MYRHHTDPLYYDPTASGRILVPVTEPTDKDKLAIIESVPAEDRGEILNDEEYAKRGYGLQGQESAVGKIGGADLKQNLTALVESDQVAAAAKRHDLKLQHAIEKQIDKKKAQGVVFKEDMEVYDEEDDEEGDDGSDVEGEDSEERYMARAAKAERRKRRELEENGGQERLFEESYDSEVEEVFFGRQKKPKSERKEGDAGKKKKKGEEENGEKKEAKPEAEAVSAPKEPKNRKGVQVFDLNDFSEPLEDVDQVLKKAHLYKPADGVRYTEYDPLGYGYKPK